MTAGRIGAGPVAILAGSGDLPLMLSDRLAAAGREHRILAFRGFATSALRARSDAVVGLLDVKRAADHLASWRPAGVALVGGVRRPGAAALLDAYAVFRSRDEIARIIALGDDNLLRGVLGILEERGHRLLGIADLAPDLLAGHGVLGQHEPPPDALASVEVGLSLLRDLSPYDVGQAVAIRGRRVLGIEGPEGTDGMLRRVTRASRGGWFRRRRAMAEGVLVKAPKLGQDLRVDLPAVGVRTMQMAARAGLAGVAVASGRSIILDPARTAAEADRLGLFLLGVTTHDGGHES